MPKIDLVEGLPWNFAVDSETGEVYQVSSGLNEKGQEIPDPMPLEVPVGWTTNNESLVDMVRRFVRSEYLARDTHAHDYETFEEADDFSWDDSDPMERMTPYEAIFEPPVATPRTATNGSKPAEGKGGGGEPSQKEAPPTPPEGDAKDMSGLVDPATQ